MKRIFVPTQSPEDWKRLMLELSYEALDVPFLGDLTQHQRGVVDEHMERVAERIRDTMPSPENMKAWGWPGVNA